MMLQCQLKTWPCSIYRSQKRGGKGLTASHSVPRSRVTRLQVYRMASSSGWRKKWTGTALALKRSFSEVVVVITANVIFVTRGRCA